jgi:hypothetical protein
MPWADFWECLDGRIWWELRKAGVEEKRQYTGKQAKETKEWLKSKAEQLGWINQ